MLREDLEAVLLNQRKNLELDQKNVARHKLGSVELFEGLAIIISGVRRSGKSTLLKQLISREKNFFYLNLEDVRLTGFGLEDFLRVEEIFGKDIEKSTFFFDEIQIVPNWEKYIRDLTNKKVKVVITGSNASLLSKELGSLLTGRHLTHELFPFDFNEFLVYTMQEPSVKSLEDYCNRGGFPEFLRLKKTLVLQELLQDILIRDIAIRYNIRNTIRLKRIAVYLLSNTGKEMSFNRLKKDFSVPSIQTIINYASFFENAYLIETIPRFSYSQKKQLVSPKKVYAIDNGLILASSTSFSQDKGRLLENIVFQQLRREHKNIFYYKEENECDFLVKEGTKIILAVQVCYNLNKDNEQREINGLAQALQKTGLKKGLILTLTQEDTIKKDGLLIEIKPVWKWLVKKK